MNIAKSLLDLITEIARPPTVPAPKKWRSWADTLSNRAKETARAARDYQSSDPYMSGLNQGRSEVLADWAQFERERQ